MMLAAAITMMLCGCSSEEMLSGIASESKTVPISVTDAGFVSAVGGKTRTAENGTKTTFILPIHILLEQVVEGRCIRSLCRFGKAQLHRVRAEIRSRIRCLTLAQSLPFPAAISRSP